MASRIYRTRDRGLVLDIGTDGGSYNIGFLGHIILSAMGGAFLLGMIVGRLLLP